MLSLTLKNIFSISEFSSDWHRLEQGIDMSYFQSYDWNLMLCHHVPHDNWFRENRIVAVYRDEICILIAPILIIKHDYLLLNKKGIYFMARHDWSDYVNFIYDKFDEESVIFMMSELRRLYGIEKFYFENLLEDSKLYQFLKCNKTIISDTRSTCVHLDVPASNDDYQKMLSKKTRQNIRTAYNRLTKDQLSFCVDMDDRSFDVAHCLNIRNQRNIQKSRRESISFLRLLKNIIIGRILYKLGNYYPISEDSNSYVLSFYEGHKLRAFFNYGIDKYHKRIVLMVAGTDPEFAHYSPGIITAYEFIQHLIYENNIHVLDFTRGTERYKYDLGGCEHYIHNICIII